VPIFREFYTVHFTAAGNILAQMIQAVLLQSAGDIAAEKVLLTLYVIVLPFSFRALLSSATRDTGAFPLMAFVLLPNFFFYMGFWHFCLSIPAAFLALSWFRQHRSRPAPVAVFVLALLSLLTYAAHLTSWAMLAVAISIEIAVELVRAGNARELAVTIRRT